MCATSSCWRLPWVPVFGGLAGGLFAGFQGFISPESFNLMESIMILCMIVLGGMGNIPGVILGAVLLTVLPEALRYIGDLQRAWIGHVVVDPSDLRMLLFGFALILMMLFRPAGLLPSRQRKRELGAQGDDCRAGAGQRIRRQALLAMTTLLKLEKISKHFGGIHCAQGCIAATSKQVKFTV